MKPLLTLLAISLLGLSVGACGGANNDPQPRSLALSSKTTTTNDARPSTGGPAEEAQSHLKGDEDDDDSSSNTTTGTLDADADADNDSKRELGYHDEDDEAFVKGGHPASPAEERVIVRLVKRYYRVAAAGNGAKACSMMYSILVEAIPEQYGGEGGTGDFRGKTCSVVMSKFFRHEHRLVADAASLEVTGVRIEGNQAHALVGSRTIPASYVALHRELGLWRINSLVAIPLP